MEKSPNGSKEPFQQMVLGQLDIYMQKVRLEPCLTSYTLTQNGSET